MKQFEIVLYPDKQKDFIEIDSRLREWISKNAKEYLIAKHEPFKSAEYENDLHFHYYASLHSNWTLEMLSKSLKMETHSIEKIKSRWKTAILYARHINKAPKPLIPIDDIETNIEGYQDLCDKALKDGFPEPIKKKEIPSLIVDYANNKVPYSELMDKLTFEEFNRYKKDIDNARVYRVKKGINRDMECIYITGPAGSGKTTLAKFLGRNLGYDIFISGSGKDPLDGYDNEECIILDDLRADTFTKSEFFKLLDNNTNSTVKSRYFNKAITRCKLLVITSIKTPQKLYDWKDGDDEPFSQFARRIKYAYIFVRGNGVVHEMSLSKDDPLNAECGYKKAPFDMSMVYNYFGIIKGMDKGLGDLMFQVSKLAREQMEKDKK